MPPKLERHIQGDNSHVTSMNQLPYYLITLVSVITINTAHVSTAAASGCSLKCPQEGDPDDYTVCCRSNGVTRCCSYKLLAGILGGVFGTILLIGIIIGVVCCVKMKRGDWVCVRIGPGRRTIMTKTKLQKFRQQQQERSNQQQIQMNQQIQTLQGALDSQNQQIERQNKRIKQLENQ